MKSVLDVNGRFSYKIMNDFHARLKGDERKKFEVLADMYMPVSESQAQDIIHHYIRVKDFSAEELKVSFIKVFNSLVTKESALYPSEKLKILYKHHDLLQRIRIKMMSKI
jgi:hypothetical protein